MKNTKILTTVKIVLALVLFVVAGLIVYNRPKTDGQFTTATRASSKSTCRTREQSASYCDSGRSKITTKCDSCNPESGCVEQEDCTSGGGSQPTQPPSSGNPACPKSAIPGCGNGNANTGDSCSCQSQGADQFTGRQTCGSGGWGGCERTGSAGPTVAPPGTIPTSVPPGGAPAGKNCKVTSAGSCGSADFWGVSPPEGKMLCCRNTDANGFGKAEPCGLGCGATCADKPQGGEFSADGCGNPYACPRTLTPQPTQPPTTPDCKNEERAPYCHDWGGEANCKYVFPVYNTCSGQIVDYRVSDQTCCTPPGTPTNPPPPTKPPQRTTPQPSPTPNPLRCVGLELQYVDPDGVQKTITSNNYQTVVEAQPGSTATVTRLMLSNGQSTTSAFAWAFDVTCTTTNPQTCTVDSLHAKATSEGYPKPLALSLPVSTDPTRIGQFNGVLDRNVRGTGECSVRIKARSNKPGRCASLKVTLANGGSVDVTAASSNNVLPRIPAPGEKITISSTGDGPNSALSTYWLRPADAPNNYDPNTKTYDKASSCAFFLVNSVTEKNLAADGSFTMPDWKTGTLTRNDQFGRDNCAGTTLNFDKGVIFGTNYLQPGLGWSANKWCRNVGPGTGTGQLHLGSVQLGQSCENICVAVAQPGTKPVCGGECNPTSNPCSDGLSCVQATDGRYFCSKPANEASCKSAPNQTNCCEEKQPQATPTPTPPAQRCGYECDESTNPCATGLTCMLANDGKKYCTQPEYDDACYDNPGQTACCSEPTPTPSPSNTPTPTVTPTPLPQACGQSCNPDERPCGEGMECVQTNQGFKCSMIEYQDRCRENGSYASCCQEATPTPNPTYTPLPTYTPQPPPPQQVITQIVVQQQQVPQQVIVQQIQPTYIPQAPPPTFTLIPTYTPFPTQPPQPTYTPVPPPPVSGNPIPFVVVGVPVILMLLGMVL